jgi:hypothetical protein
MAHDEPEVAPVTAREVFDGMAPLIAPVLEASWGRRDLCILSTRVAIETARYFGVEAEPVAVRVVAYNAAFARHVAVNFADVEDPNKPSTWGDGSWSVGIGCGKPNEPGRWDGHLIAVADGCMGDFSIQQAERLEHGIQIGPALVGPYRGARTWKATNKIGTVIEYTRMADDTWRHAPDWTDEQRRRPIVGKLIRALRDMEVCR